MAGNLLEDQGSVKIILRWILGRCIVRMGRKWDWVAYVPLGGLWYQITPMSPVLVMTVVRNSGVTFNSHIKSR
jgi:hypothetical protein